MVGAMGEAETRHNFVHLRNAIGERPRQILLIVVCQEEMFAALVPFVHKPPGGQQLGQFQKLVTNEVQDPLLLVFRDSHTATIAKNATDAEHLAEVASVTEIVHGVALASILL